MAIFRRVRARLRGMKIYVALGYWKLVLAAYGPSGIPREILRILLHPQDRTLEPATSKEDVRGERTYVDLSSRTDFPHEAIRIAAGLGPDIVPMIRVPMSSLRRNHLGVAIDDRSSNPFTRAVADYLSGEHADYRESAVHLFYETWQPRTLAEFLGLSVDKNSALASPLITSALPWESGGIGELVKQRALHELDLWVKFGPPPGPGHGYDHCGPISDSFGEYRFRKHCDVARSIAIDGFMATDHIIDVQLLAGEGSWALIVRDGKHRTTALATLDVESIVVCLPHDYPVIRREHVASWPGVVGGIYTANEALNVFDRFVKGAPPEGFPVLGRPVTVSGQPTHQTRFSRPGAQESHPTRPSPRSRRKSWTTPS